MRIKNKYQIEKAAATDPTRYVLTFVHIAEDGKHLIATNGRILAMVPVEIEKSDDRGSAAIPGSVLVDARKKAKRAPESFVGLNGEFVHADSVRVPRPAAADVGAYVNYGKVIPKDPVIKHTVSLNPELLLELAKAIGGQKEVTLEFQDGGGHPAIIVRSADAFGLIMPVQVRP